MYKRKKQYRLPGFNYTENGSYFITIVTKGREHFFGRVENNIIHYTPIGHFVKDNICYLQSRQTKITIDAWTIMPNHIHLLLTISISTTESVPSKGLQPLIKNSVSAFVNHFKGFVTKWCTKNGHHLAWQARFHDRIIRDEKEYSAVLSYIENNVANWQNDKEL